MKVLMNPSPWFDRGAKIDHPMKSILQVYVFGLIISHKTIDRTQRNKITVNMIPNTSFARYNAGSKNFFLLLYFINFSYSHSTTFDSQSSATIQNQNIYCLSAFFFSIVGLSSSSFRAQSLKLNKSFKRILFSTWNSAFDICFIGLFM